MRTVNSILSPSVSDMTGRLRAKGGMVRGSALLAAALIALLTPATQALAGGNCCKPAANRPRPANGPNVPAGNGAAAVVNGNNLTDRQNLVAAEARRIQNEQREIVGDYLGQKSGRIPVFDRVFDKTLIDNIQLIKEFPNMAGKSAAIAELLKRGVTVLPTDAQMQALVTYRDKGATLNQINGFGPYQAEITNHNEWAQNEINARGPRNQYGSVTAEDYRRDQDQQAVLDHQLGPIYESAAHPL